MGYETVVGLIISAAGTAAGVASSITSSNAAESQAQYQAMVAKNNQTIANQNADLAIQQGQQQEAAQREKTAQKQAMIAAAVGASGFDSDSPSAVRLQKDTATLGETDALTIRNNAMNTAIGLRNTGSAYGASAAMSTQAAKNDITSGWISTLGSFASGTGKVADKWLDNKKPSPNNTTDDLSVPTWTYTLDTGGY